MNTVLAQVQDLISTSTLDNVGQKSFDFYASYLPLLKTVSVIASVFFVVATVYFAMQTGWIASKVDRVEDVLLKKNVPKRRSVKVWREVQRHLFAGDENSLKLAIIEADKILDDTLRLSGFRGENLGDRLKKLNDSQLPNIDQIWEAHKLRNRLVHEAAFALNRDTAERALAIYEQAFKDMGLLE